ncbi:glycosyl transferase [Sinomonas cyclohexanicum]|uniref:D-inositol 3-phosphate glycosyltransferase n=1 Tax=Sinomonas cyclohexanicum TaxID=322009 RepID=A0ABM7PXM8_SINCY|nr:glycosyltransferase [Corynebacterium cyclohexanicum]BCT77055.1 glycosyl transferase [Corynebacterium cyclohexanicum]
MQAAEPTIAIAHDYLTQRGGAERVVLAMHRAFPEAKIYTTLYDPDRTYPEFRDADIVTSPLNRVAAFRRDHRLALPVLAPAAQLMRIPADIVVTSTSGWAHGFTTDGLVYAYCHSPARWLYLTEQYLGSSSLRSPKGLALAALRPFLKRWDQRAAARAHTYVANSTVVQDRIRGVYGRDAAIVHPPHSVDTTGAREPVHGLEDFVGDGGHFLTVSRLLPYKNVDQTIEAFRGLDARLLVIGAGPLADALRATLPPNVRLASHLTDAQMRWAYSSAAALIAPSYEDFGLTPLEGAAWGKPTIALRAGGYLDTIVEGVTGTFIEAPTAAEIRACVAAFSPAEWDEDAIRDHASSFSEERFRNAIRADVLSMVDV